MGLLDQAKKYAPAVAGPLGTTAVRAISDPRQAAKNVVGYMKDPLGTINGEINSVGGQIQDIGTDLSNGAKGVIPHNDFVPNMPTNNFNPNMPVNSFHADAPQFAHTDFASALQGAMADPYGGGPNMGQANAIGDQQGAFANALLGRTGQTYGQQQGLINQLQGQAMGQGPGSMLAQNMMNQGVENATKQGAGLIASQKGINPALAARLIAQNTGAMGQNAAAQGANLGLQQQLAAQQQLGGLLGQQQGLDTSQLTGLYGTQRGQDISSTLGASGQGLDYLGHVIAEAGAQNATDTTGQLGSTGFNAGAAHDTFTGGVTGQELLGSAAHDTFTGGVTGQQIGAGVAAGNQDTNTKIIGGVLNAGGGLGAAAIKGPAVAASHGAKVPGKAKFKGDDPRNDTVDAELSPGEVVIPRSAANDPEKAAAFVAALKGSDKKSSSKSGAKGYGKILEKHRELQSKMKELEALIKRSA